MNYITRFVCVGSLGVLSFAQLPATGQGAGSAVPGAGNKFATMVSQTDLAEIEAGNMALQKSSDPQVKQIAQKLVDDDAKTATAMKEIAAKKGMMVPTAIKEHTTIIDQAKGQSAGGSQ